MTWFVFQIILLLLLQLKMAKAPEIEAFKKVTARTYEDQAKFFLNAFWKECSGEAENIWNYTEKFIKLDTQNGKKGSDLDEFSAHRFLEQVGETKRVVELRESLRAIDLDFNKRMALIEFLLFRYKQTIKELLSRPQGESEELKKAEENLRAVQQALEELQKEEQATNKRVAELEKKTADPNLGQVLRNSALNELEQLRKGDNLRLRKGKLTTACAKAQKYFDDMRTKGGAVSPGSMWWLERELKEAQKYMPQSKQKK